MNILYLIYNKPLLICCLLPLIGILGLILGYGHIKTEHLKLWTLFITILTFDFSLIIWINFKNLIVYFQNVYKTEFISTLFELNFYIGIDGVSLFFVLLTTFILPICILTIWNVRYKAEQYLGLLLTLEFFLILSFTALDLTLFYIFFESLLLPMYLIIGIWGSRWRKVYAAYYFFLYTLVGSLFMLLAIIMLSLDVGTTSVEVLLCTKFSVHKEKILWVFIFIALSVKMPTFPFHIWLPEAHVEAPTTGSIILASLLLKLGAYGMIRFLLPVFPKASLFFVPLVYTLAILSVIYGSVTTIRQTDLKRIVAYSSVAHMNLVVLGIFSRSTLGISGAIVLMVSHGITSGALFLMIGILYNRYHNRSIDFYGGLTMTMPIFSTIFFLFNISNLGMPGTSNFVGEALVLFGTFPVNTSVTVLACSCMILSATYSLWMFNRVTMGTLKAKYSKLYVDLNRREFYMLSPLVALNFIIGIYPSLVLNSVYPTVKYLMVFVDQV